MPSDLPEGLFPGVPYDYAAIAPAGSLLFTAGACPLDSDGDVVGPGAPDMQARASTACSSIWKIRTGSG
jgi:hypothetical protein